jgi:hypothetical protein
MFHGGTPNKGNIVTYYTTSEEMAKSYAEMYNDRFGSGGDVHRATISLNNPAPEKLVNKEADRIGIDHSGYTPASIFDQNLHGKKAVFALVKSLKNLGYDGTILGDIAYGKEIEDNVYIVFS